MMHLGLCCIFRDQPIKFRTTTATAIKKLSHDDGRKKLADLCASNAQALMDALKFCSANDIGCFRVNSQILPLKTHPDVGYELEKLPDGRQIVSQFRKCGAYAKSAGLRTAFHPDQFVVMNSPRPDVIEQSIAELEYQAEVAQWIGADVVNIHVGGAYGDKRAALRTFVRNLTRLPKKVRKLLTIENDDRVFTPANLVPFCREQGIPFVYDIHHHRCTPDGMSEEEATRQALTTWDREPLFHISSPLEGWDGPNPRRHRDYINIRDFPAFWQGLDVTVEVEAKAKELAVRKLAKALARRAGAR
ncbi:MAG: UV DNA damage repair endonuclease UvsE [Thermoguttaceae bacterium]